MTENFKSVKVKLKTIIKDPKSITVIQNTVNTIHNLTSRTYQFIKAYCLYCFHEDLELPILDVKFIRNCFVTVGLKGKQGPKSKYVGERLTLETFRSKHFNYPQVDIRGIAGLLKYQATEIETCYKNNLWMHFIKRLQKYIRFTIPEGSKTETKSRMRQILKALKADDISLMPEGLENWFTENRNLILPEAKDWYKRNLEFDLEKNPFRYLWYLINMELQLELKNVRTFSVFPLRDSEIPKHILLDTEFFAEKLLSKKDKHLTKGKQYISRNRVLIAKAVFNFKKRVFRKKKYIFHHQIRTDGISASVILRERPKPEEEEEEIPKINTTGMYGKEIPKNTQRLYLRKGLVGVDPGKHNLVYMVDSKGNRLRYTQPQRQTESKKKKYDKKLKNRTKLVKDIEAELSNFDSRSCFPFIFDKYVAKKIEVSSRLKEFYSHPWFREWRFRLYCNRKRSEDEFLNKAKEKFGNKVLAYGDWKGGNFLRNQTSSLGIGMKRLLAKRFKIFSVDEFRSSKLHCLEGCNHPLENESKGGVKKHRLLVCTRCSQQNVISQRNSNYFVNRDFNAATNILQLGKLSLRNLPIPFCFQRETKWEEVKSNFQPSKAIQISPKS